MKRLTVSSSCRYKSLAQETFLLVTMGGVLEPEGFQLIENLYDKSVKNGSRRLSLNVIILVYIRIVQEGILPPPFSLPQPGTTVSAGGVPHLRALHTRPCS